MQKTFKDFHGRSQTFAMCCLFFCWCRCRYLQSRVYSLLGPFSTRFHHERHCHLWHGGTASSEDKICDELSEEISALKQECYEFEAELRELQKKESKVVWYRKRKHTVSLSPGSSGSESGLKEKTSRVFPEPQPSTSTHTSTHTGTSIPDIWSR